MVRYIKKISQKIGLTPGTLTYVGEKRHAPVTIDLIDYDQAEYRQVDISQIEDCFAYRDTSSLTWINVNGIHDLEIIRKLGAHFGIHQLALEDITNTGHRPKLEEGEDYVFLIIKMLQLDDDEIIKSEQVSIVFGKNWVISFQEKPGDVFGMVRDRIKKTRPREKFLGADYLAYTLVDAVVDHYFLILEYLAQKIEDTEEDITTDPRQDDLHYIHHLKRELIYMRRAVWPLREVIGGLERSEAILIHSYTRPYLRDLYEHAIQVIDTVETYRDMVGGLLDIYLSSISNRMNAVMKVLTIIATIFIPLSFLTGIYGMNFDTTISPFNMPELGLKYGYILFWILVLIIGGGLVVFFKTKKWL